MKKIFVFVLVIVLLISGCSFNVQVVPPVPAASNDSPTPQEIGSPTPVSIPTEPQQPTPQPLPADAFFHDVFFTVDAVNGPGQPTFPAGTKQIFALWDYQNMRGGMTIKRE